MKLGGPFLFLERLRLFSILASVHSLRLALSFVAEIGIRWIYNSLLLPLILLSLVLIAPACTIAWRVGSWQDLPGRNVSLQSLIVLMLPFPDVPTQSLVLIVNRWELFVFVDFLFSCLVCWPLRCCLDGIVFWKTQLCKSILGSRRTAACTGKLLLVQRSVLRSRHCLAVLGQRAGAVDLLHGNKVRIQFPKKLPSGCVLHEIGIRRRAEWMQGLNTFRKSEA